MTSPRILSTKEAEKILESVVNDEGILNPIFDVTAGSNKGDGYLSSITKVDVTDENNPNQKLNVMIKMAPNMESYKSSLLLRTSFKREIYFYNTIVPTFIEFQKDQGVLKSLFNIPKCFKTKGRDTDNEYEYLVLDNMKCKGYTMWNRMEQMDEDHIIAAFKQCAKFHAVSYAMKKFKPTLFAECTKKMEPVVLDDKCMMNARKLCERCFKPENVSSELYDSVRTYLDGLNNSFSVMKNTISKYAVVLHGDCWCNNVLFSYTDKRPSDACLLDFQLSFLGSPAIDLCYFMFVSANDYILDNYRELAEVYHEELVHQYIKLGGKKEELLTYFDLMTEWKIYARYGFTMALFVFRAMMCEEEETLDYKDLLEKNISIENMFADRIMKREAEIEEKTKTLAEHMNNNGFFLF